MHTRQLMKLAVMEARSVARDRDPDAKNISWPDLYKLNEKTSVGRQGLVNLSNTGSVWLRGRHPRNLILLTWIRVNQMVLQPGRRSEQCGTDGG